MKTPLAWRNVMHGKVRSLFAVCGICFAMLLIFMQLGFHAAARSNATSLHDILDFDVLVTSPQYLFLARPSGFPRNRLQQIRALDGIVSVAPLWIAFGDWRNPDTRERWNILTLAIDPSERPFRDDAINDLVPLLKVPDAALADSISRPEMGPLIPGTTSELNHHRLHIVGRYAAGGGFTAGATILTGRDTFFDIFEGRTPDTISLGLVKLAPGISPSAVAAELRERLSPAAIASTRPEIVAAEQRFWLKTKPIGIMFSSGVAVAVVTGMVILYQVLADSVQHRLREFATLKALGYSDAHLYGSILRQGLILSLLGFAPAFLFALPLYSLLRTQAFVPVDMPLSRAVSVGLFAIAMCFGATILTIRKLRHADPADLF